MRLELNPALDTAYLERVYGDDANIIYMIFDAFLTDCLPRWEHLKSLIEDQDLTESASLVHGLKPAFTMSGMGPTKKRVEALEILIKDNAGMDAQMDLYNEINDSLKVMVPILRAEAERLKHMS